VRQSAPPAVSQEDGWITARAPREGPSRAITADDPDESPYDLSSEPKDEGGTMKDEGAGEAPSADESAPSIALPTRSKPLEHEWEATATFRTRLWTFLAYEMGQIVFGLMLYFGDRSSLSELLAVFVPISALAAYILGTYDRVNLSRNANGDITLSKTWRFCFIPLKTKEIPLRGFYAVATSTKSEREILDWLLFAWLLSLGLLPGILWWIFVMSKPIQQVSLARDHGIPALVLYQGVDQKHAHDMAKTVGEVCRYRWRRA
jgi:hypothetical protein